MTFKDGVNYTILSTNINKEFISKLASYVVIEETDFNKLKEKLDLFPSKQVVFHEAWFNLTEEEIKSIINLLRLQKISFLNVTADVENILYSDYVYVFDGNSLILEGTLEDVFKNEKQLRELGFSLPFVVELSKKLNYYDILNKTYYDMRELVDVLWN